MVNTETPCILVDINILKNNIDRMAEIARQHGVALRPHTKTHKIPKIAKIQLESGAVGITVAKVSEAEVMMENGINDIFIAYPVIGGGKIERVLSLNQKIRLIIGVDSLVGAKTLAEAAARQGQVIEVRLEVDTGLRRTGIPYQEALLLAQEISALKGLDLTGIYTFRGLIYQGKPTMDREKAGLEEGRMMVALADEIRAAGIAVKDVSVGSTPTGEFAAQISGVTEIRPGTYVFNDVMQSKIGVCALTDCAAKVLATVISKPDEQLAILDGGSKTFATDVIPSVAPLFLNGYGAVDGKTALVLDRVTEEHGMLHIEAPDSDLYIGKKLRIIPNHICSTINLHNQVYFVDGDTVLEEVKVLGRGMLY